MTSMEFSLGTREGILFPIRLKIALANDEVIDHNTLKCVHFSGTEQISQPFEFQLELHGNLGSTRRIADFMDRPISVCLQSWRTPNGNAGSNYTRNTSIVVGDEDQAVEEELAPWLHGIVTNFSLGIRGVYYLTMRPPLWRLSLRNDYRIYKNLSAKDLLQELLKRHDVKSSLDGLSGGHNPAEFRVQDWMQAGESDLDLFQRVLHSIQGFYYVQHTVTEATLVVANSTKAYGRVFKDDAEVRYVYTEEEGIEQGVIRDFRYEEKLVSTGVTGTITHQEAAWEKDTVATHFNYHAQSESQLGSRPFHAYQVYQYGGSDSEVDFYTRQMQSRLSSSEATFSGSSDVRFFHCGLTFKLAKSNPSIRPELADLRYVITGVQHQCTADGEYSNSFEATESCDLITPFDMHDTHQGAVIGKVIAHAGATPPSDWKHYLKTNFEQDTDILSCTPAPEPSLHAKGIYVRLSTDPPDAPPYWVKLASHMQQVPEIGVSVMIARAQDESEVPEVQSIVQNNGNYFVTPSGWTANTTVGNSYSTSFGDSQSVRFPRDNPSDTSAAWTKVATEYAEPGIKDSGYSIGGSYSYSAATQGRGGTLSKSDSIGSTYSTHEAEESKSTSTIDRSHSVMTGDTTHSEQTLTGLSYSESTIGSSENYTTIENSSYSKTTLGSSESYTTIEGESYNETTMDSSKSYTTIDGHSYNWSKMGSSENHSRVDTSVNVNMVGAQTSTHLAGVQNDNSLIGASNSNSAVGLAAHSSFTGASLGVSMTGVSAQVNLVGPGYVHETKSIPQIKNTVDDFVFHSAIVTVFL